MVKADPEVDGLLEGIVLDPREIQLEIFLVSVIIRCETFRSASRSGPFLPQGRSGSLADKARS